MTNNSITNALKHALMNEKNLSEEDAYSCAQWWYRMSTLTIHGVVREWKKATK